MLCTAEQSQDKQETREKKANMCLQLPEARTNGESEGGEPKAQRSAGHC